MLCANLYVATLNLRTVCNELGEVKHKAYEIGNQLGIPLHKMKEFKQEGNLLSSSVDYWLNGNVPDVPVTWKSIVTALETDFVGELGCALKISTKYCRCQEPKG